MTETMLPGALFPVRIGECAARPDYMQRLGIRRRDTQERYCKRFCAAGCCPFCQQIMLWERKEFVPEGRIPIILDVNGNPVGGGE